MEGEPSPTANGRHTMRQKKSTDYRESLVFTDLVKELPVVREATTSRVVLNNELLRVVLFSFDAGQLLTEHSSPRAVIVQMLDGKIEFTVGGETTVLTDGDIIYLAPGERHALTALEPSHMALTLVDAAGVSQ